MVFWLAGGHVPRLVAAAPPRCSLSSRPAAGCSRRPTHSRSSAPHAPRAAAPRPERRRFREDHDLETRLAYIITGDAEVDNVSKTGLQGLTLFLAQRTALEAGEPVGLDPARDELAFFPLIYWPIVPNAARPTQAALTRIDAYMKQGGTILFDTRDAIMRRRGPAAKRARRAWWRCAISSPRSTFPNWSRCRATTC